MEPKIKEEKIKPVTENQKSLTEDQVRKIIRDELQDFVNNNKYTFSKPVQFLDGRPIQFGVTTGSKLGEVMTIKQNALGFYDATPVAKQALIADPTGSGTAGVDGPSRIAIVAILDLLIAYGLMASA